MHLNQLISGRPILFFDSQCQYFREQDCRQYKVYIFLSAVQIKVPPQTHQPNRKAYRPVPIFEKWQISADISVDH